MSQEKKSLVATHPQIAAEANGWDPREFTYGSGVSKSWKCMKGHVWNARINARTNANNNCKVCTSIAYTHPEIAAQAHNWDPSTITHGSEFVKEWKCISGHIWRASVLQRTRLNTGCRECIQSKPEQGKNDLNTTDPEIAKEAYGWDPKLFKRGHSKKKDWICPEGHIFSASIKSRVNGKLRKNKSGITIRYKSKCPVCTNKKLIPGLNDLLTINPGIAKEAHGWDPSTVFSGTNKKKDFKCQSGHVYQATVKNRTQGHGCPTCSPSGYKRSEQGWIYLLENLEFGYLQIGITNNPKKRITNHTLRGWNVLDLKGPMKGEIAALLERQILTELKLKGGVFELKKVTKKFAGYSECWERESFPARTVNELFESLEIPKQE